MSIRDVNFNDDKSIVDFVEGRWKNRDTYRRNIERQWYINLSQIMGHQYHTFDWASGKMVIGKVPSWRVRYVANRLLNIVRKIVSKAMRQRPRWVSVPATSDMEDQMVSTISEKTLKAIWREQGMDAKFVEALHWMASTGNVFLSVVWDPSKAEEFSLGAEDLPEQMREDKNILKLIEQPLNLGGLDIQVHSPFDCDPERDASTLDDSPFLHTSRSRSIGKLEDLYGDAAKGLEPDTSEETLSRYYQKRIQHLGTQGQDGSKTDDDDSDRIIDHQLWVDPTKKYPKGYWCTVAGGKVLKKLPELPNPFHKKPFIHLREIWVPGRFWGTCVVEHCIGPQAEYNLGRSKVMEARRMMGFPKLLEPSLAQMAKTAYTDQPGERITYLWPFKPEVLEPAQMPEHIVRTMPEFALKDLDDVSAQHDVTQGKAGSNLRSGVGIAQLQEQDDTMLAPTFQLIEGELAKIGSWSLQLMAENVSEERMMRMTGDDKQLESFLFTGNSLFGPNRNKPGVTYCDVEVQLGSQLPSGKQQKLQYIIDLTDRGILDRVNDRKTIFRMLELGTDEGIVDDQLLDRQRARLENVRILQGEEIEINPWDNGMAHLEEHRRFQKQPQYLESTTPDDRARHERHCGQHEMAEQARLAPPEEAAPPQGQPQIPELEAPPVEAEMPQTEEEAFMMAQQAGAEFPEEMMMAPQG